MSQWFRMYSEVVDDPKVQRLSLPLFKAWVNIMCIAAKNDGILPSIDDIAYSLHVPKSRALTIIEELERENLIDRNGDELQPHNWNGRQFKSDSSTDRVKRFRNGQRNVSETADETDQRQRQIQKQNTEPPIPPISASENGSGGVVDEIVYPEDFQRFWTAYPKHKSKGDALKVWKRLRPSERLQESMHSAIEKAKRSYDWTREKGQFIPYPASWLNANGWDDEAHVPAVREARLVL